MKPEVARRSESRPGDPIHRTMTRTDEIDALFALPLAELTAARNALASRLRKEERAAEAERVTAIPRRPATAWAVNQLYHFALGPRR